jgi:signal transduction histidine kinase
MPAMADEENLRGDIAAVEKIAAVPMILDVVCKITGMGFAAVARVTETRWIACAVKDDIQFGLKPGGELQVETTICHEIRQSGNAVVIDHVVKDQCFSGHPTPAMYGFQSYISMPIFRSDGSVFGTLCAIDPRPAALNNPQTIGMFRLFADLIAFHLDAIDRLEASRSTLIDVRKEAELREQFIAVLGHDLRNPLASIMAGTEMLRRQTPGIPPAKLLDLMDNSSARMSGLIDNVLDFARGRLGGGIETALAASRLEPVLRQVIEELRITEPERRIDVDFSLEKPVYCDKDRIGQLVSNLLANAITHGSVDVPIRIAARSDDAMFELTVSNAGAPISPATLDRLFQPFFRGDVQTSRQGLGLGLYIASEIARAHGGTLSVTSSSEETRFTLRMPPRPPGPPQGRAA